jgi:DNA-binding transcriptional MerR regulator
MAEKTRLLSTRAAADRLGYSPRTLRLYAQMGLLEPIRMTERGHLRFRERDIERLAGDGRKVAV